jgi:hypothetical protein
MTYQPAPAPTPQQQQQQQQQQQHQQHPHPQQQPAVTPRTARAQSKAPAVPVAHNAHVSPNHNHAHTNPAANAHYGHNHHPSPPASNAAVPGKPRPPASSTTAVAPTTKQTASKIWNTSLAQDRERIKEFWLGLAEDERRNLVRLEKEAVLRKMKEQQKHSCSCAVCGRKRSVPPFVCLCSSRELTILALSSYIFFVMIYRSSILF